MSFGSVTGLQEHSSVCFAESESTGLRAEEEEDEEEDAKPKTKKEIQWGWELLNDNKAIWLRSAGDVEDEEYDKFYQALSKVRILSRDVLIVPL